MTASDSLKVLLVDDDFALRTSVGWMLRCLGHRVSVASNGLEAIKAFQQGLEVDLVVLDFCMPLMDGQETLCQLRALRPDQAVLMVSGMSKTRVAGIMVDRPSTPFLAKPFSQEDLRDAINALAITPTA